MKLGQMSSCPAVGIQPESGTRRCSLALISCDSAPENIQHYPGVEILLPLQGSVQLEYSARQITVNQGDLILLSGMHPYRFLKADDVDFYRLRLSLMAFFNLKMPSVYKTEVLHGLPLLLSQDYYCNESLLSRWQSELGLDDHALEELVLDEVCLFLRRQLGPHLKECLMANGGHCQALNGHVVRSLEFIHQNYTCPIGIAEIAEHVRLNKNFLMGLFKKSLGITVLEYLTARRLSRAQKQLLSTDEQVIQVAFSCGFGSVTRFYEVFKQYFGISPLQYRKRHLADPWYRLREGS
ncbi:helix-turn-helix domain-containing protein [Hahella ganghwensis]|uniref:helix-turn-helix domain-containing protein n=1 Tax=Hahella ganghwensis TaxID=286420 RepID=UPI000373BCF6|nr:helix-turn-helix domain-containing protein [Hahella ganghwensis]